MIGTEEQRKLVREQIGFLFDKDLLDQILELGKITEVPADVVIIDPGQEIEFIPFVLDGSVKVSRENPEGDELLLYYIETGDTCAMTLQCCVSKKKSQIKATTLEPTTILKVPVRYMEEWMRTNDSWRQYILQTYHLRMVELIETIDAIAFMRLDERLEKYLKDQAKLMGSLEINYTHQQIAEDLHSSRVVISRLLKQMELKGMIELKRNKIILASI